MKTHRHLSIALLPLLALLLVVSPGHAQDTRNLEFTLESITVEPAGGDAEFLVRRHCPLRENQTVTPDILLDARAEMLGTGLFDKLDIYTARGSRPGVIRAVVTARPSRRFLLESGVGREPFQSGHLDLLGVRRTGLFHRGGWARVSARWGPRSLGFYGDLEVPGATSAGPDLLLRLATYRERWPVYTDSLSYRQTIQRDRAQLGLRGGLSGGINAVLWLGVSSAHPSATLKSDGKDPNLPATTLLPAARHVSFLDLEVQLQRNRRDRQRAWQKGNWAGIALRMAEPNRGPFAWSAELDTRCFVPVLGTRPRRFACAPRMPRRARRTSAGS